MCTPVYLPYWAMISLRIGTIFYFIHLYPQSTVAQSMLV